MDDLRCEICERQHGADNPCCPKCQRYNALLASSQTGGLVCRDCGYATKPATGEQVMGDCKVCAFVGIKTEATDTIVHNGKSVPVCKDCKAQEEDIQEELKDITAEM